jgi:flagellar biogenesis protein FliO
MRNFRLLALLLLFTACRSAHALDATPSHTIPALPQTALGAEPVGHSTEPTAPPLIPGSPSQPQSLDYPRVLAALGIVIGLIFVLRWFGRFFFPAAVGRGKGRAVEIISRSPLSPKQQVMLLRVGRRLIVVGDSGSQMNPLCEITDPDEVAALVGQLQGEKSATPTRAFGSMFGRSRQVFESEEDGPAPASSGLRQPEVDEPPVASAREELSGLRERVRLLAEQFKGA